MKKIVTYIYILTMVSMLSGCFSSDDYVVSSVISTDTRTATMVLSVGMTSTVASSGYVSGTDFENTIDSYRVFLYDTDNIYVGELENTTLLPSSSGATDRYILSGQCDYTILSQYDDIKVVFIANWPYCYDRLRDDIAPAVGSTIEDLCNPLNMPDFSLYFWFDSENGPSRQTIIDSGHPEESYIAFYGVHEYDNFKTQYSEVIELTEPLTLLRAPAKVEVVFDEEIDVGDIDNIQPYFIKQHASCAPIGVYHQDDYINGHLLKENINLLNEYTGQDGTNHGTINGSIQIIGEWDGNTWQIYFPEWDNALEDYNYIYFIYQGEEYHIYFANYVDGKTTAYSDDEPADMPDRMDIERNNLYRFYVSREPSYTDEFMIQAEVLPWVVMDSDVYIDIY